MVTHRCWKPNEQFFNIYFT